MISIERYHDISCGHRVVGHESKCRGLHGHNYRITFTASAPALDELGRVIDFSVLKEKLCMWLEKEWDHKMLLWQQDPFFSDLIAYLPNKLSAVSNEALDSIVLVPFNPTAENMAEYLLSRIGPRELDGTGVTLIRVRVEETRKCSAIAE